MPIWQQSIKMDNIVPAMEQLADSIDPSDLVIFARVADLGSFSRAAGRVGLPKSTVSRRIAALEKALGERILLRTTRRQELTEFGKLLLGHANQVVAEIDAVVALRDHRQAVPNGRLRVTMPADIASHLLSDSLARFVADYPAISLELDLSARRVDLLAEGFDLAIRMGELTDDALLVARRLCELPGSLYASPAYIAVHGDPATPEALEQHQALHLIGRSGAPRPWRLRRGNDIREIMPPGRLWANSPESLIGLARAGAGIAAAADYFAAAEVERGSLQRVLCDWSLPGSIASAVYPGRKLMPPKTRVFLNMLQHAFAPYSG